MTFTFGRRLFRSFTRIKPLENVDQISKNIDKQQKLAKDSLRQQSFTELPESSMLYITDNCIVKPIGCSLSVNSCISSHNDLYDPFLKCSVKSMILKGNFCQHQSERSDACQNHNH